MIVHLDVPYSDSEVSDLRYSSTSVDIPVLDSIERFGILPGCDLSLRLLGASHQAILNTPYGVYAETVACMTGVGGELPSALDQSVGPLAIKFNCQVEKVEPGLFAMRCDLLRSQAAESKDMLAGVFPGDHDALTYLNIVVGNDSCGWETVHTYPSEGRMVSTKTTIRL